MNYRLTWIEHWSFMHESDDPRVLIRYTEEEDGGETQYTHEYILYFNADNDGAAREYVRKYIDDSSENIEIFNLVNRKTKQVIMTEEVL